MSTATAPAPQISRPRPARPSTGQRWQAALMRAHAEGVQVRQLAGCGMWVATSTTDTTVAYEVSPFACECHAGQYGDSVCKHRAALREQLGWLALDPEPTPPAVCATCGGTRWVPKASRFGAGTFRGPCPTCVPSAFPLRPAA